MTYGESGCLQLVVLRSRPEALQSYVHGLAAKQFMLSNHNKFSRQQMNQRRSIMIRKWHLNCKARSFQTSESLKSFTDFIFSNSHARRQNELVSFIFPRSSRL